jgi:hypothetical protein
MLLLINAFAETTTVDALIVVGNDRPRTLSWAMGDGPLVPDIFPISTLLPMM